MNFVGFQNKNASQFVYFVKCQFQVKSQNLNMNSQSIKNEYKVEIQKIRQPTSYCEACLGQKIDHNDVMLTCSICESSIHKSHYASQLIGKNTNQSHLNYYHDEWRCQKCRYLVQKQFQVQIKCQFCPLIRGIMKRVILQAGLNNKKQIWVHPSCTTWCHPLIWMKSKKRTHYFKEKPQNPTSKFWFRVENQPIAKCHTCSDSYGYKIKCSFYSCLKFYHITCAKNQGVVRDLQSMRFDNSDQYCPVYCEQHLDAYVVDFSNRNKLHNQKKQTQKAVHFTKLHHCYKMQLKNLTNSAKKMKQDEQNLIKIGKQLFNQIIDQSSMSLEISQPQQIQGNSSQSESHSSGLLAFLDVRYNIQDLNQFPEKKMQKGKKISKNQKKKSSQPNESAQSYKSEQSQKSGQQFKSGQQLKSAQLVQNVKIHQQNVNNSMQIESQIFIDKDNPQIQIEQQKDDFFEQRQIHPLNQLAQVQEYEQYENLSFTFDRNDKNENQIVQNQPIIDQQNQPIINQYNQPINNSQNQPHVNYQAMDLQQVQSNVYRAEDSYLSEN